MDKRKNTTASLAFGAAAVWFGSHCGSGFCTGTMALEYFSQYGWAGVFTSFLPFIALFVFACLIGEYARCIGAKSYKDVVAEIYTSNKAVSAVLIAIWDILAIMVVFVSVGSCLAAAATLLSDIFSLDYFLGTVLVALMVVAINSFDAKMLTKISKPLVYVMIVCIIIICVSIIHSRWDNLLLIMAERRTFPQKPGQGGLDKALLQAFNYVSLQSAFCCGAWLPIMGTMRSRRDVTTAGAVGAVLNGGMLALVSIAIVSQMPAMQNEALPIYSSILSYYGRESVLLIIYQIALFLAILTTATASTFNATARWSDVVHSFAAKKRPSLNKRAVNLLVSVLLMAGTICVAQFGLRAIISRGYTLVATLKAPLALSAGFIFAPIRLHQMRRKAAKE